MPVAPYFFLTCIENSCLAAPPLDRVDFARVTNDLASIDQRECRAHRPLLAALQLRNALAITNGVIEAAHSCANQLAQWGIPTQLERLQSHTCVSDVFAKTPHVA
jgi:nitrate reductase beta subunit